MEVKLIKILSALALTAIAGVSAHADEAEPKLAWQEPGYVEEVVIARAPRFLARSTTATDYTTAAASTDGLTLAWQESGYEEEVVVAKASRREVLAEAGWFDRTRTARIARFMGMPAQ
jgi:hypothetical protein